MYLTLALKSTGSCGMIASRERNSLRLSVPISAVRDWRHRKQQDLFRGPVGRVGQVCRMLIEKGVVRRQTKVQRRFLLMPRLPTGLRLPLRWAGFRKLRRQARVLLIIQQLSEVRKLGVLLILRAQVSAE